MIPTPVAIYERAFERLASYPVPAYAVWTDTWKVHATPTLPERQGGDSSVVRRYAVRLSDGMENGSSFPMPSNGGLPNAQIGPQFQGPFAWSIHTAHVPSHGHGSLQADVPPIKIIAHVTVVEAPPYAIELTGTEKLGDHQTYHLQLKPRSDPARHNLRDLWVDTETFDLRKAHFEGTYAPTTSSIESNSDVTVLFAPIARYWIVSQMLWTWNDVDGGFTYVYLATTNDIAFPDSLPDWLFNREDYFKHQGAHDSDPLMQYTKP